MFAALFNFNLSEEWRQYEPKAGSLLYGLTLSKLNYMPFLNFSVSRGMPDRYYKTRPIKLRGVTIIMIFFQKDQSSWLTLPIIRGLELP